MKLISNARDWWKMSSIQVAAAWTVFASTWSMLPESQRTDILGFVGIPAQYIPGVLALVAFASILLARITKQEKLSPGDKQ